MANRNLVRMAGLVVFILSCTMVADSALARERRKKRKKVAVVELRLSEGPRVMKFSGFQSMKVEKPALLKIVHDRKQGTFTWIPRRRGVTKVHYRVKSPKGKGTWKVIIR